MSLPGGLPYDYKLTLQKAFNVTFKRDAGPAELALARRFKALQAIGHFQYARHDIDYDNWKLPGSGEFDGHLGEGM